MRQIKISHNSITDRTDSSVNAYLNELSTSRLLTPDEEAELAIKAQNGDQEALNKLVEGNLLFTVSVAKSYQGYGMPLPDLISEGNIGLIIAAKKYDPSRGFRFISFAVWWIRQSILKALSQNGKMIRLPQNVRDALLKINKIKARWEQEMGTEPSEEDIAEEMDMEVSRVHDIIMMSRNERSLDDSLSNEDGSATVGDLTKDEDAINTDDALEKESVCIAVDRLVEGILNEREKYIIKTTFGIGQPEKSMEQVSSELGLTRERVRQIKERAIMKMRKNDKARLILRGV